MRIRGWAVQAALSALAASVPASAHSASCAMFTDVQDTDPICNSVQWLRNRQITLGCAVDAYCPGDTVSRATMALFFSRLGVALTPELVGSQNTIMQLTLPQGSLLIICPVAPTTTGYPRTARARGTVSVPANGSALDMSLVVSVDSGPWTHLNTERLRITSPAGPQLLTWSSNTLAMAPGAGHLFGIGISNPPSALGPLALGNGQCAIEVDIVNANPTAPPFDP